MKLNAGVDAAAGDEAGSAGLKLKAGDTAGVDAGSACLKLNAGVEAGSVGLKPNAGAAAGVDAAGVLVANENPGVDEPNTGLLGVDAQPLLAAAFAGCSSVGSVS